MQYLYAPHVHVSYHALQVTAHIWGVYLGHDICDMLGTHKWESVSEFQYWI